MKALFLAVTLTLLIISCSADRMEIKSSEAGNGVKDVSIKTTKVEISEETRLNPILDIISPIESQLIKNSTIIVKLLAENFNIVPIGVPVKENEGHFHVWLDSEKRITAENISVFGNVGSGRHSIVAELVKSNHSSLSPKIIKSVNFNVESSAKFKPISRDGDLGEYTIEADDRGFYPNKIRSKIGDNVTINFKFRDHLIYYAGLDVIGPFPDIKYKLGDEQPISRSFIMLEETIIKSFWPSTGVKKAELVVEVEK